MRKHIAAIIASAVVLSVTHTVIAQHSHHQPEEEQPPWVAASSGVAGEQQNTQKYTCPMHPEVITEQPGNCPKCGMKLVPIKGKKRRMYNAQHSTSNIAPQPETHLSQMSQPSDATDHG